MHRSAGWRSWPWAGPDTVPDRARLLTAALRDESPMVRYEALRVYGQRGTADRRVRSGGTGAHRQESPRDPAGDRPAGRNLRVNAPGADRGPAHLARETIDAGFRRPGGQFAPDVASTRSRHRGSRAHRPGPGRFAAFAFRRAHDLAGQGVRGARRDRAQEEPSAGTTRVRCQRQRTGGGCPRSLAD